MLTNSILFDLLAGAAAVGGAAPSSAASALDSAITQSSNHMRMTALLRARHVPRTLANAQVLNGKGKIAKIQV
jgi:hypothetical protein